MSYSDPDDDSGGAGYSDGDQSFQWDIGDIQRALEEVAQYNPQSGFDGPNDIMIAFVKQPPEEVVKNRVIQFTVATVNKSGQLVDGHSPLTVDLIYEDGSIVQPESTRSGVVPPIAGNTTLSSTNGIASFSLKLMVLSGRKQQHRFQFRVSSPSCVVTSRCLTVISRKRTSTGGSQATPPHTQVKLERTPTSNSRVVQQPSFSPVMDMGDMAEQLQQARMALERERQQRMDLEAKLQEEQRQRLQLEQQLHHMHR